MPRRPLPTLHSSAWIGVAATLAVLAGCGSDATPKRTLALAECRLPNLSTLAQCGEIEVPENRDRPDGRRIRIFAAVLPANTLAPKDDPLLIIAGGPGQAASTLAPFVSRLNEVRRTRDVVLVDQRGTGRSSPLDCAAFRPRDDDALETDPLPRARACAAELKAQGVDAAQYTTSAYVADLEAMRAALGYASWNVWGGSYGTRVAQEYLRRHPERIRTLTLDAVVPPSMITPLDVWRTRQATYDAVVAACAASAACSIRHPDPGALLATIAGALGPAGRDVASVDPRTGKVVPLHLTFDGVLSLLQPLLYTPETSSLLPEMLALAAAGDFGPLVAATQIPGTRVAEQVNAALNFSVSCAEDVPRITPELAERALAGLPARQLADNIVAVCTVWPRGSAPADFAEPVASDKPVLLFSGALDPVTPPANGELVARTLPHSRHVVAAGYGHIVSPNLCGPQLVAAFVDAAGFATLPAACLAYFEQSRAPALWSDRLEPQP